MSDSPYRILGVEPSATLDELTVARRRRAQQVHPDLGGDGAEMQRVNAAYDEAVRLLAVAPDTAPPPASRPARTSRRDVRRPVFRHGVQYDTPSFTVDVLPVEAFEALLIVTSWIGEVVNDDPPYALELLVHDPLACFCRLELVPDAGGTTISLAVAPADGQAAPDIEEVRDLWVACLNEPL